MEAIAIITSDTNGVCADAHVENLGWQGWSCGPDGSVVVVGTTGQSLRMEALALSPGTGQIFADAYLQDVAWQGWHSGGSVVVGTTGQSRRMEAISITVNQEFTL